MAAPRVEVLYDAKTQLGEGPFYDHEEGELIYVDITANLVNFLNVETLQHRSVTLPEPVSAAIPVEGSRDKMVVTVGKKICLMGRQTGTLEDLAVVEHDLPTRFNDAKCDARGRLWAGTIHDENASTNRKSKGALYMFTKGCVTTKLKNVHLSNGMAWNRDQTTMFFNDSLRQKVLIFDYSPENGDVSNERVLSDYCKDMDRLGLPDGMTIDTDDNVWVASFTGKAGITCWTPTGQRIHEITIPAPMVTSCCFGGPEFSWLFVTTSTKYMSEEQKKAFPLAGSLFVVKDTGVRGHPNQRFKLN